MKYPVYACNHRNWLMFNPETDRYFYTLQTIENVIHWAAITSSAYGHDRTDADHLTLLFEFDPDDYPEYRI